jgi:acyl-CoA thioester hydrolase
MPHTTFRVVEDADIDELGHVSNVTYVRWVVDAAVAHTLAGGIGLADFRQRGQAFVVRRHTVDYLRPALLGERIRVDTRVLTMRATSSERETVIVHVESGAVVAHALTLWAYIDLAAGRLVRVPPEIRHLFAIEPSALPAPARAEKRRL